MHVGCDNLLLHTITSASDDVSLHGRLLIKFGEISVKAEVWLTEERYHHIMLCSRVKKSPFNKTRAQLTSLESRKNYEHSRHENTTSSVGPECVKQHGEGVRIGENNAEKMSVMEIDQEFDGVWVSCKILNLTYWGFSWPRRNAKACLLLKMPDGSFWG